MNYLTYPFKTMRITQRYDGTTSHLPHMTGTPKEYALDEGGVDAGRDWLFCPCDEMKIVRIYGVGNKGVNSVWLTSTTKCDLANGKQSVVTIILTHPNDDDLKKLKQGQTIKRGQAICREGTDGASGNHIHMAVGLGTITGNGWTCNSKGKYVLTTTGGAILPENAFFLDPSFTTIRDSKKIVFRKLPTSKYQPGDYKVTENAPVRSGPGTKYAKKTFTMFTEGARERIKALNNGKAANYFVKGVVFTAKNITSDGAHWWGECPSGWVCLEHCEAVR